MRTHVVILGASFAGLQSAANCVRLLGERAQVTVIDQSETLVFRPSLPWLVTGEREADDITRPLPPLVHALGARFVQARVEAVDARRQQVLTTAGRWSYDFLVIALGATSPPRTPADLAEYGHSYLWLSDAEALRRAVQRFSGGSVVIAFCPRSPLACAAWEIGFQLDQYWRRRGLRHRVNLSMVTYEDRPLAWAGETASRLVGRWLRQSQIDLYTSTFVKKATPRGVYLADGTWLAAALLIYVPDFSGPRVVQDVPDLTDTQGFILVDPQMRSLRYPNIYAAGDIVSLPGPKAGRMALEQGRIVARNIAADLGLRSEESYTSYLACLVDLGVRRGLLAFRKPAPQQGRTRTYALWAGWIPHMGKIAVEHYFLDWRLRAPRGLDSPVGTTV